MFRLITWEVLLGAFVLEIYRLEREPITITTMLIMPILSIIFTNGSKLMTLVTCTQQAVIMSPKTLEIYSTEFKQFLMIKEIC